MTLGAALAGTAAFTLLNPHVYIDTVLLAGSVGASLPAAQRPFFVVGAALASFSWFAALGFGARLLTPLFARPIAWKVLDLAVGVMMMCLAVGLLSTAARSLPAL
jgi:L-lysine exporter family protein LysE/ArgO